MSATRLENDDTRSATEPRGGEAAPQRVHALTMAMDALAAAELLLGLNFSINECGRESGKDSAR